MSNQLSLFDGNSDYFDSDVSEFDEKIASFRVHSSLIYKLGESLIADEVTALSELIKNSYDADATFCSLSINTDYSEKINDIECKGLIELIDNGCGMDLPTIVNGWLTLSNSPKKRMKKDNETTPKYHRYPLGDKGLGRLSVQKLGRHMQMITKASSSKVEYTVTIPWGDFLKNTTIDKIPVTINKTSIENDKSYTKIIIRDLINTDLWENPDQINILSNSISKIVSPFKSKENNNFKVIASVNKQSIDSVDTIFNDLLSRARAKHTISYENGKCILKSYFTSAFFYNREMINKIKKNEFSVNNTSLKDFWNSHKINLNGFEFHPGKNNVFILEDSRIFEDLLYTDPNGNIHDPGRFECDIYEYTLDKQFLDNFYQTFSYSDLIDQNEYKDFIERFHGIKVVRDGFIVQGIGEGDGGDWLGLSSYSKTKGNFFDFRNDSVIGCVYLSGAKNASLKETTNREGFVEDETYLTFKKILIDSIRRINRNRKKLNDEMRAYINNSSDTLGDVDWHNVSLDPAISSIQTDLLISNNIKNNNAALFDDICVECKSLKDDISNDKTISLEIHNRINNAYLNLEKLSSGYKDISTIQTNLSSKVDTISFEFGKIQERLQDLFELAGLGISVEMFSHEFDASIHSIRLKNDAMIKSTHTSEEWISHINYINYSLDVLRKQMSYFNPGLKYIRSEKQKFSFNDFINEHKKFYSERCVSQNIEYLINVDSDFFITINRGMLNQVFDNLFNNSEYWLNFSETKGLNDTKTFTIQSNEKGVIVVFDNGIGISKDIETRLFNPFESKKENGRGLGLYIAANNLKYNSCRIRLLSERNKFDNLYKFEIDLTSVLS